MLGVRGENGKKLLQPRVNERARDLKVTHDAALRNKLRKLPNPTSSRNDMLVHNLSSKELTKEQLQFLRHKAVESVINQTAATEETRNLIRHQVSSLLKR
uniref:Uncharacterized protein n=1 Tax=Schistocephalus solidus TaxID=70667 RepID=A0A0X3NM20_SCHSO